MSDAQDRPTWRDRARRLKQEVHAVYLAYGDPRVPWYAKVLVAAIVAYALSPIDLIPDFIPVLGYLDDLILLPAGIALAIKMIPPEVMAECRRKAASAGRAPRNWTAAVVIACLWGAAAYGAYRVLRSPIAHWCGAR
jgi:uncharacterized membrane protein YkvA (DUF1232 family)